MSRFGFVQDLSLHILDIVENSLAAGAGRVEIRIEEDLRRRPDDTGDHG